MRRFLLDLLPQVFDRVEIRRVGGQLLNALTGSFGEIFGGKPVYVLSRYGPVSSMCPSNELMRRCLLRRQSETLGGALRHFWRHSLGVSFKDRFLGHLTNYCAAKSNSLAPKITRLLPGSAARWTPRGTFVPIRAVGIVAGWVWGTCAPTAIPAVASGDNSSVPRARAIFRSITARSFMASRSPWS